jgi:hypothetical protein
MAEGGFMRRYSISATLDGKYTVSARKALGGHSMPLGLDRNEPVKFLADDGLNGAAIEFALHELHIPLP